MARPKFDDTITTTEEQFTHNGDYHSRMADMRLRESLDVIEEKVTQLQIDVAAIKARVAIAGAIACAIMPTVTALLVHLLSR